MKEKLNLAQIVIRYILCTMNLLFFSTVGVPTAQASALLESGEDYPTSTVEVPIAQASAILTYVAEHIAIKGAELILGSLGFGDSEKDAVEKEVETIGKGITQLESQFQQLKTKVTNDFQSLGKLDANQFEEQDVKDLNNIVNTVLSNKSSLDDKIANSGGLIKIIKKLESYVEDANKGSEPFENANSSPPYRYEALKKYDPDFVSTMEKIIADEIQGQTYYESQIGTILADLTPYSLNQGKLNRSVTISVAVNSMQSVLIEYMHAIQQGGSNSSSDLISLIARYDTLLIHQAGLVVQAVEDIYESKLFLLQLGYMGFQVPGISINNKPLMYQTPKEYQMSFAQLQLQEGLLKEILAVFYQGNFYTDYVQKPDDYILQNLDDGTLQRLDDYILQKLDDDTPQKLDDETLQKLDDETLQKLYDDNLFYIQVRDLNILPGGTFSPSTNISSNALSFLNALSNASKHFHGDLASLDPLNVDSVLEKIKDRTSLILVFNQVKNLLSSQDENSSSNKIITLSPQREDAGPFAWNERCMIFQYYSLDQSNQQSTEPLLGSYDGTELKAFCQTADQAKADQTELTESILSLTKCHDPSTDVPIVPNNLTTPQGNMFCQLAEFNSLAEFNNDVFATDTNPHKNLDLLLDLDQLQSTNNWFEIDNNPADEYDIYLQKNDVQYVQLLGAQGHLYQVNSNQWQNGSNQPSFTALVQVLTENGDLGFFGLSNELTGADSVSLFCMTSLIKREKCLPNFADTEGQFSELTLFGNCTVRLDGGGDPIRDQKGYLHICEGGLK